MYGGSRTNAVAREEPILYSERLRERAKAYTDSEFVDGNTHTQQTEEGMGYAISSDGFIDKTVFFFKK